MSEETPLAEIPVPMTCYNHPKVETSLRCSRCERPICVKCAVLTPTGYRCKECVRGQQKAFETARWSDYLIAFVVGSVLSFIGGLFVSRIGFFTIILSPVVGVIIAEAVRYTTGRRRSRRLYQVAAAAVILGGLPILLPSLLYLVSGLLAGDSASLLYSLISLLWPGLYIVLAVSSAYYRLSGIQLGK